MQHFIAFLSIKRALQYFAFNFVNVGNFDTGIPEEKIQVQLADFLDYNKSEIDKESEIEVFDTSVIVFGCS